MARIVAGSAGGRVIKVPSSGTRPTSDRVREALFSVLVHDGRVAGARVLDLYAGSGALGLEALSRGAEHAVLVESGRAAAGVCRANAASLGLSGQVQVVGTPVEKFLSGPPAGPGFDLVFCDPPYDVADVGQVLADLVARLAPDALVVVERSVRSSDIEWPEPLVPGRARSYGETRLHLATMPPSDAQLSAESKARRVR